MSKQKSFGIGCFHFGVKKTPPFDFKGSDYLTELNKELSKIASLTNLKIETDEDFKKIEFRKTEITENLENDEGYFPQYLILDFEFNLYIPFRIQAEIKNTEEKYLSTFTENFKVKIIQFYYLPVAIVETINPTEKNDPSSAVQIVREFIRRELTDTKSNYIRFECLGPSPFHCDFFIEPKKPDEDEDWLFSSEEELMKGYDNLIIYYNSNKIKDSNEALEYLYSSIQDEFGFFYKCIQTRNVKMHNWQTIQENLNSLLGIQNAKGLKGIFQRLFNRPKLIGKLFTDIATFEGSTIFKSGMQQNEYKATFSVKDEIFFKTLIDKELEEKLDYPIKQTTDLIHFFESRRVKSLELITALIAAILGGVIGALLTISLQDEQPNTSDFVVKPLEKTMHCSTLPKAGSDSLYKDDTSNKHMIK
jgi:hypothetical protein